MLPVTAVNKRTHTPYVLVTEAGWGLLRCYTAKGFESMQGVLAKPENVKLYEPLAPVEEARFLMKIALLVRHGLITLEYSDEANP